MRLARLRQQLDSKQEESSRQRRELFWLLITVLPFLALGAWVWSLPMRASPGAALAIASSGFVVAIAVATVMARRR